MSDVVMMSKHALLLQSSNSLNPINILEKDLTNMSGNLRVRKTCWQFTHTVYTYLITTHIPTYHFLEKQKSWKTIFYVIFTSFYVINYTTDFIPYFNLFC